MGDPVGLTVDDRFETVDLARRIVESVRDDEPFPISGLSEIDKGRVLMLAQYLLDVIRLV